MNFQVIVARGKEHSDKQGALVGDSQLVLESGKPYWQTGERGRHTFTDPRVPGREAFWRGRAPWQYWTGNTVRNPCRFQPPNVNIGQTMPKTDREMCVHFVGECDVGRRRYGFQLTEDPALLPPYFRSLAIAPAELFP